MICRARLSPNQKKIQYTDKNIHCLFSDVNNELTNINEWFVANKLSLNAEKN